MANLLHQIVTGALESVGVLDSKQDRVNKYNAEYYSNMDYATLAGGGNVSMGGKFRDKWIATTKYQEQKETTKIVGAQNLVFREITIKASDGTTRVQNGLTVVKFDDTSYPDRTTFTLRNDLGYDCLLTMINIDGNLIHQYSGESGELLHDGLRNDDDIRRNGERCLEIGNKYIIDAAQVAKIADYWWKASGKKKHLYSLQIPGTAWWYKVGGWYTFRLGSPGKNEYIDATVECFSVDVERTAGGIGSTSILLREVEENWAKTTLYAARLVSGGSPKRLVNRSNTVTVASSTYDGTYDYRCDGVDDDVQIQAAIDYVYNTYGGGRIQLTDGVYRISNTLRMKTKTRLLGVGTATILMPQSESCKTILDISPEENASIENFVVDGNGTDITFTDPSNMYILIGYQTGMSNHALNIQIKNYNISYTIDTPRNLIFMTGFFYASNCVVSDNTITSVSGTSVRSITAFGTCRNVDGSTVENNYIEGGNISFTGFSTSDILQGCTVRNNTTSAGVSLGITGFTASQGTTSCYFYGNEQNTVSGLYSVRGYLLCNNIASCVSRDNTSSLNYVGYDRCARIAVSTSYSNAGAVTEKGFASCNSLQHCYSDDTVPYDLSYADSGTSNACADTAAGGYNS